jgi:coenzyme F420 biosynthesis associated uncharacterized protein
MPARGGEANSSEFETMIDWRLAGVVARALAGNGSGTREVRHEDLRKAARGSVRLVRDYTGLEPHGRLPAPEVVDRREWIDVNLETLRLVSAPLERSLAGATTVPGPLGAGLRSLAGAAAGAEVGIASGFLAQRVLGQYDVTLIGPARPPRLLFVAPNLAEAQRRLEVERAPFLRWIALHEATHVVQFSSVPWLRDHIGGIAEELLGGAFAGVSAGELVALARRILLPDPRRIVEAIRSGDWFSPFESEPRARLLGRLQTAMAVVEGYSEHVMDAVAADMGPGYAELRERLERRRAERNPLEALISRLLGLEMKMRQYKLGKAFCDEVADRGGIETLNRVWSEPSALPRPGELRSPGRWMTRMEGPPPVQRRRPQVESA